jgi:cycloartenol synthase
LTSGSPVGHSTSICTTEVVVEGGAEWCCRQELFCQDYDTIDWNACRTHCAKEDLYYPQGPVQRLLWWTLYKCENFFMSSVGSWLRARGLAETMKLIAYEDKSTNYIDIGPVNKAINMLCCWLDNPEGEEFRRSAVYSCFCAQGMRT